MHAFWGIPGIAIMYELPCLVTALVIFRSALGEQVVLTIASDAFPPGMATFYCGAEMIP